MQEFKSVPVSLMLIALFELGVPRMNAFVDANRPKAAELLAPNVVYPGLGFGNRGLGAPTATRHGLFPIGLISVVARPLKQLERESGHRFDPTALFLAKMDCNRVGNSNPN